MRVAVCHYWLINWRGGERVIHEILKLFPQADIYTLFASPKLKSGILKDHNVYSPFFDIGPLRKLQKLLFPFYPLFFKFFRLKKEYDLLITSESGPAKAVGNPAAIPHLCYIHTPMRYCWDSRDIYLTDIPKPLRGIADYCFERLRKWDYTTKDLPDKYVANSKFVSRRVQEFYGKEAEVLNPPVEDFFFDIPRDKPRSKDYYLYLGAITPYKNVGFLMDTFSALPDQKLVVAGFGSLEKPAGANNITIRQNVEEEEKIELLYNAKALIMPQIEDFGIVALEAMALGTPVIAAAEGGALESVVYVEGSPSQSTGCFFQTNSREDLMKTIEKFELIRHEIDPEFVSKHAGQFSASSFRKKFSNIVNNFLTVKNSRKY